LRKSFENGFNGIVRGWVKSKENLENSMLGALADHMRKNNIVRVCKLTSQTQIYFLDSSKANFELVDDAQMIFVIFL